MNNESENFLKQTLDQVMSDRFGRYSKYIIQDRALPDVRDGLKPVQRRILFSMHELGLTFNRSFKKSARVVGDVIGKYHPHGDSSIYEAMVRMSQNWKMNIPLIEMHGNNGSIDDDPAAAMRYTEAKLSKISDTMLNNIKKETVFFAPNFDDSEREPTVLPGLMPNLLVNGARGIAAGYATEMPPHNLSEIIDAIIAKIKSPNARLETLMNFVKGPDFPTGGIVQGKAGIYQAFERGRGRIVIRSKYTIVDLKTKPSITVTEIPYGVNKQKLVKDIDEIRFNSKIDGIKEVRDESDRNGISILIELTPGTDVKAVLNYLLSKTELQVYYNYNNVGIKNKVPTQMGIIDLIDAYLEHQKEIQTKSLNFELSKDKTRLEIVEGLIKVSNIAEQVIDVIRNSEGSKQGVVKQLMNKFSFTQLQANAIAELRLYRLSKTDQSIYLDEQAVLNKRINQIHQILNDENNFNNYLIDILKELKKVYGTERKTKIEDAMETITVDMEALIKHEDTWLGITTQGYIKRFSNRAYEANNQTDFGLKESDSLQCLTFTNTSNKALIFTNKGNYFFIPIHLIKESKFQSVGNHLNDFAVIAPEEKVIDVIVVDDFNIDVFISQVTKYGRVKRTKIQDFEVARFSKTYKSFKLKENDEVVGARISNGFKQLVIFTSQGKAVRYSETQTSLQGTKSSGSKGIFLLEEHFVTSFVLCSKNDVIGLVSRRGGAKRIKVSSILPMSKLTQGKQAFRDIKGNPHITTDARVVKAEDKIIYSAAKLIAVQFNKVVISKSDEGFSAVGPSMSRNAKILIFDSVDAKNPFLEKPQALNEEQQFARAEDAIKEIDQLNIDDLLKDL